MKKFDIKKLLILVLAFVMVFALVACNKGGGGEEPDDPTPVPPTPTKDTGIYIEPAAYFNALWKASAVLGSQTFAEEDAAALSADLDIMLALGDDVFDLGLAIGAVLDPAGECTAVKVQIYDKEAGKNWFTIFYFAEDQDNLYVEAYDQKLCIPVAVSAVLPDVGALVKDLLDNNGITDVINKVKTAGGASWTIDNLVDVILGLLGMSLDEVIQLVNGLGVVTLDEGADSLLPVLEQLGGILFKAPKKQGGKWTGECTREEIAGGFRYTGNVGGSLGLVSMLAGLVTEYVGDLINANSSLQLIFDTVEDKDGNISDINGFKIRVESYECEIAGGKDVTVQIGINEVKIENFGAVKEGDAADFFGFKKADFSTDFNITLALDLAISNKALVINVENGDETLTVDFTGAYKLELNAKIDLAENLNTKADLALTYNGKPIISAYFGPDGEASQLVITVDNTIAINEVPVVPTLAEMFAPMGLDFLASLGLEAEAAELEAAMFTAGEYNTAFTGVAIKNIKLVDMLLDLINGLIAGGDSSAEPALSIPGLIATVFDAISFEKGIEVKVDSILATIQAIFGGLKEEEALAMLKITAADLADAWWTTFFKGSAWIKDTDVASLTNLIKSAAEVSISIADVAKINAKVTTPEKATVEATISLKGVAKSSYEYNDELLSTEGLLVFGDAE